MSGNWKVKMDDGQSSTCGSLQSAADIVRTVLKTHHPAEIWHWHSGSAGWELYERFEPDTGPDRETPLEAIRRGRMQILDHERGQR